MEHHRVVYYHPYERYSSSATSSGSQYSNTKHISRSLRPKSHRNAAVDFALPPPSIHEAQSSLSDFSSEKNQPIQKKYTFVHLHPSFTQPPSPFQWHSCYLPDEPSNRFSHRRGVGGRLLPITHKSSISEKSNSRSSAAMRPPSPPFPSSLDVQHAFLTIPRYLSTPLLLMTTTTTTKNSSGQNATRTISAANYQNLVDLDISVFRRDKFHSMWTPSSTLIPHIGKMRRCVVTLQRVSTSVRFFPVTSNPACIDVLVRQTSHALADAKKNMFSCSRIKSINSPGISARFCPPTSSELSSSVDPHYPFHRTPDQTYEFYINPIKATPDRLPVTISLVAIFEDVPSSDSSAVFAVPPLGSESDVFHVCNGDSDGVPSFVKETRLRNGQSISSCVIHTWKICARGHHFESSSMGQAQDSAYRACETIYNVVAIKPPWLESSSDACTGDQDHNPQHDRSPKDQNIPTTKRQVGGDSSPSSSLGTSLPEIMDHRENENVINLDDSDTDVDLSTDVDEDREESTTEDDDDDDDSMKLYIVEEDDDDGLCIYNSGDSSSITEDHDSSLDS